MSNKKGQRPSRRLPAVQRSKAQLLPIPQKEAFRLVLRTRIVLQRLRDGEATRSLLKHLWEVVVITSYVTRQGYGKLEIGEIDRIELALGRVIVDAYKTGTWKIQRWLVDGLTTVVNEYDRQLAATRLEILSRANEYVDRVMHKTMRTTS